MKMAEQHRPAIMRRYLAEGLDAIVIPLEEDSSLPWPSAACPNASAADDREGEEARHNRV